MKSRRGDEMTDVAYHIKYIKNCNTEENADNN